MLNKVDIIRPGLFSKEVSADNRRFEFDYKNEVIISNKIEVDYVFIGDSITHMWELNAYFGKSQRLVLNRGIGGDTSEYLLKRFEADVIQLKPKYCILEIGVNDMKALESDPWMGKTGQSPEVIEAGLIENINSIIDLSVRFGQELIIGSILPTNMPLNQKNRERNELIISVNNRLEKISNDNNMIFVNYHAYLTDDDGKTLADGLSTDGLHPHVCGYNIMSSVLKNTLKSYNIDI